MSDKTATGLVKAVKLEIERLTPDQVSEELAKGDVVLVDVRESEELKESGRIAGSTHVPIGMLAFFADPSSPQHKSELDKNKRIILQCASGTRSALGVARLKQMGYNNIAHLEGGLNAWKDAG